MQQTKMILKSDLLGIARKRVAKKLNMSISELKKHECDEKIKEFVDTCFDENIQTKQINKDFQNRFESFLIMLILIDKK